MRTLRVLLVLICTLACAPAGIGAPSLRFDAPLVQGVERTYTIESEREHLLEAPIVPGGEQREAWRESMTMRLVVAATGARGARVHVFVERLDVARESSLEGPGRFSGEAGAEARAASEEAGDELFARALGPAVGERFTVTLGPSRRIIGVRAPVAIARALGPAERAVFDTVLGDERLRELLQPIFRPAGAPDELAEGASWTQTTSQRSALGRLTFTGEHTLASIDDALARIELAGDIAIDTQGMGRRVEVERERLEGAIEWDVEALMARSARSSMDLRYSAGANDAMRARVRAEERIELFGNDADASRDDLSEMLERACARFNQPAMAAAVVTSEGVVAIGVSGTRVVGMDLPVGRHDMFHIGSCTKAMTAALLMRALEGDDALTLDATLAQAFPDLADAMHGAYTGVTLRQVLAHEAGLPTLTSGAAPDRAALADLPGVPREARATFAQRVLTASDDAPYAPIGAPGTMRYSNAGYGIAAALTERLEGRAWEGLLRTHVFGALGMERAGLGWPADEAGATAQPRGHTEGFGGLVAQEIDGAYELTPAMEPAGDVHASIDAWARFAIDRLRALRGGASDLLGPEATTDLVTPAEGARYAGGWIVGDMGDNGRPLGHDGSAGTFYATAWLLADRDLGVLVVSNAGSGAEACAAVRDRLVARYAGEE